MTSDDSVIFLNPKGWIEVQWGKSLGPKTYLAIGMEMISLVVQMEDSGRDPLMLIDFTKLKSMDPAVVPLGTNATRDLNCKKMAGFGIDPAIKPQLDSMKFDSLKADMIREFATREEAEAWLLSKDS